MIEFPGTRGALNDGPLLRPGLTTSAKRRKERRGRRRRRRDILKEGVVERNVIVSQGFVQRSLSVREAGLAGHSKM